jgi:hypothetical protein
MPRQPKVVSPSGRPSPLGRGGRGHPGGAGSSLLPASTSEDRQSRTTLSIIHPRRAPQPSTTHRQRTGRVCEQHRRMWRRHGCRAWAVRAAQHSGRGGRRISPHGSHIRSVSDVSQSLMISTNRGASPVREMNALLLCVRHRHQEARRREGVEHTMRCGRQRLRPRSQRR